MRKKYSKKTKRIVNTIMLLLSMIGILIILGLLGPYLPAFVIVGLRLTTIIIIVVFIAIRLFEY